MQLAIIDIDLQLINLPPNKFLMPIKFTYCFILLYSLRMVNLGPVYSSMYSTLILCSTYLWGKTYAFCCNTAFSSQNAVFTDNF